MTTRAYRDALRALLTPAERRVFARLDTPQKIQAFLEKLPPNFELEGETYMSPRRALKARTVHCAEAAVLAAAILIYHGQPVWLMDIRALPSDQDHIVTLVQTTRAVGRDQQDQSRRAALARSDLPQPARSGDDLRA